MSLLQQYNKYILKLLLMLAISILGGAYFFEFIMGLYPCELCLYQRIPWLLLIGICSLGIIYKRHLHLVNILIIMAMIILMISAALAVFHVGVEQHWWQGFSSCSINSAMPNTLLDLKAAIMTAPVIRCDDIAWSLFGVSMAGYNAIISIIFSVLTIVIVIKMFRDK